MVFKIHFKLYNHYYWLLFIVILPFTLPPIFIFSMWLLLVDQERVYFSVILGYKFSPSISIFVLDLQHISH